MSPRQADIMRTVLNIQFVRFVLIGALNTGFSYTMYATFLYFGLGYVTANLGALLLGILFSFRTQGNLVFGNRDVRLIVRFAACWGAIWLANISLISVLIHASLSAYWAGALALVPITVASYLVQKFVVFGASRAIDPNNFTK